jgi:hypothetical protein
MELESNPLRCKELDAIARLAHQLIEDREGQRILLLGDGREEGCPQEDVPAHGVHDGISRTGS